jgi:hypothetical protein
MRINGHIPIVLPVVAAGLLLAACQESSGPFADRQVRAGVLINARLVQEDRFGLPAVATVFIPTALKDAYNTDVPANDRTTYKPLIVAKLLAFGVDAATADALGNALAPDIQPIDLSQPTGFLNGRRLSDDVITAELGLIFGSNAALNDDHVDANDRSFLASFPYLAPLPTR